MTKTYVYRVELSSKGVVTGTTVYATEKTSIDKIIAELIDNKKNDDIFLVSVKLKKTWIVYDSNILTYSEAFNGSGSSRYHADGVYGYKNKNNAFWSLIENGKDLLLDKEAVEYRYCAIDGIVTYRVSRRDIFITL